MIKPATLPASAKTVVIGGLMIAPRRVVNGLIERVMFPEFFPQQPPCGVLRVVTGLNLLRECSALLILNAEHLAINSVASLGDDPRIPLVSGRGDCCQKPRPRERGRVNRRRLWPRCCSRTAFGSVSIRVLRKQNFVLPVTPVRTTRHASNHHRRLLENDLARLASHPSCGDLMRLRLFDKFVGITGVRS